MPPLVAAAAIGAGGALGGAALSSHASGKAAALETTAASHAADVQAKAAAEALAFQKTQADRDLAVANATQKANYDQWAAREGRLSNLSALTGAGPFTIPAYSPLPDATTAPPTSSPMALPAAPAPAIAAPPSYQTTMAAAMSPQAPRNAAMGASGSQNQLVTLKSPTGEVRQFAASDPRIDFHLSRGAVRI